MRAATSNRIIQVRLARIGQQIQKYAPIKSYIAPPSFRKIVAIIIAKAHYNLVAS